MSTVSDTDSQKVMFRARVREVAEFCCRHGDLVRGTPSVRAEQGQEAQRQVQQDAPEGYRREVPVSGDLQRGEVHLHLAGRIDGLWESAGVPVIDEIKATLHTPDSLPDGVHAVNLAQAKLYAALQPDTANAPRVRVRVLYRHVDTDTEFIREEVLEQRALHFWFEGVTLLYLQWLQRIVDHRRQRDEALAALHFPWPDYRPGQHALMTHVWRTIKAGQVSLVQAATGSGKTLSMLFPALKALPAGTFGQIRFLTAKTTGQRSVGQALDLLEPTPVLLSVFPGARDRLCPCLSSADPCDRLKGYFDRLPAARHDALVQRRLDEPGLFAVANRHCLCPHAFAREMAPWADLLAGDYNHEFDPAARLREPSAPPGLLLVDEAHNLADRARAMHSTRLSRTLLASLLRCDPPRRLKTAVRALESFILHAHGTPAAESSPPADTTRVHPLPPEGLDPLLDTLSERLRDWLDANREYAPEEIEALWFSLRSMRLAIADWGPAWRFISHRDGTMMRIETWCIDPGHYLHVDLAASAAALIFSGTLAPRALHTHALGLDRLPPERRGRDLSVPHALRDTRLNACIVPWRMEYRHRDANLPRILTLIPSILTRHPGRWLACCASFRMLQVLQSGLESGFTEHALFLQEDSMSADDRTDWLGRFSASEKALGLVISGGSFAEGLDLADTPLTGVIMVGMPVPPPAPEREALSAHFQSAGLDGPDLAWTQPALERTLQTAGRLLRRDGDRGLLVLIDSRYASTGIRKRLPAHWEFTEAADPEALFLNLSAPAGPDPATPSPTR